MCYAIAYPHLQYAITSREKAQPMYENRVQVKQNRLIKLVSKNQKHKAKLLPMYNKLSSMKSDQTYKLELLKFWDKFMGVEFSTLS